MPTIEIISIDNKNLTVPVNSVQIEVKRFVMAFSKEKRKWKKNYNIASRQYPGVPMNAERELDLELIIKDITRDTK